MSPIIVHPISALFALLTAFSVAVHDTKIDRFAAAVTVPGVVIGVAAADIIMRSGEKHVHVEGPITKVRTQSGQLHLPKVQPRGDEREVIQPRRLVYQGGGETNSIWPSV